VMTSFRTSMPEVLALLNVVHVSGVKLLSSNPEVVILTNPERVSKPLKRKASVALVKAWNTSSMTPLESGSLLKVARVPELVTFS